MSEYTYSLERYDTLEEFVIAYQLIVPICPICLQRLKPLFQFNLDRAGEKICLDDCKYGDRAIFYCPNHVGIFRVVSNDRD